MPLFRQAGGCAKAGLLGALLLAGCTSAAKHAGVALDAPLRTPFAIAASETAPEKVTSAKRVKFHAPGKFSEIKTASYDEPLDAGPEVANAVAGPVADLPAANLTRPDSTGADLYAGRMELSLAELVDEVQRRNPTLQAALAAWAAASQRYPQVVALEDPVFQSMFAPGTFSSNSSTQASYLIGIAQKVPWAGKRALRGEAAQSEATAASLDSQDVRLQLAEAARLAFFDYYLVRRDLELNSANVDAVERFRETANSKYESNQVTQQDVLQADVELARAEAELGRGNAPEAARRLDRIGSIGDGSKLK